MSHVVIPANAGVQRILKGLDSDFRRNDGKSYRPKVNGYAASEISIELHRC